jgi:hypothetical protein
MPSTAVPTILKDPGYLFWAPPLSALPTFTVVGSKFTDAWPVAWISLGATTDGTKLKYSTKLESISVAEFFDPILWITTERSGSFAMALASVTLANLNRALNNGTLTVVSGTGATTLSKLTPTAPGAETRAMIGWESLDSTMRAVAYQSIQGGDIELEFLKPKADSNASIPVEFNFEVPAAGSPVDFWAAGVARMGA